MTPLDGALQAISLGWYVFPISAGSKIPLAEFKWRDASTRDGELVRAWAERYALCNWAVDAGKSGLLIIDIDPGGDTSLADLEIEHGDLPTTRVHTTPRGGRHIIFRGTAPSSAGKLGVGIDSRSSGGYALLPNSVVAGKMYAVEGYEKPVADAPAWIVTKLGEKREREKAVTGEPDLAANISRAKRYMAAQAGVRPGERGSTAYRHAAALRDFGLSISAASELLAVWNERCDPPQDESELELSIDHAWKYAQNEAGAKAVSDPIALYAGLVHAGLVQASPENIPGRRRLEVPRVSSLRPWRILTEEAQDALVEPAWLCEGHIPENSLGAIIGAPESYKSFVASDLALSIAANVPWLGRIPVRDTGVTIFCAGEGAISMARKRRPAWRAARGIEASRRLPFLALDAVPLINGDQVSWFIEDILTLGLKPKIVIFDTLARMLGGLDESSAKDMGLAIDQADRVKRELGCSVVFVAHTGKDPTRGLRGSSAALAAFDWAASAEAEHSDKTVELKCIKMKDAERFDPIRAQGHLFSGSLVFTALSRSEYEALTGKRDELPEAMLEEALQSLAAASAPGQTFSTKVVAQEILKAWGVAPDDEQQLRQATGLLKAGGAGRYRRYAQKLGPQQMAPWLWRIA